MDIIITIKDLEKLLAKVKERKHMETDAADVLILHRIDDQPVDVRGKSDYIDCFYQSKWER
mgnify:FL=1